LIRPTELSKDDHNSSLFILYHMIHCFVCHHAAHLGSFVMSGTQMGYKCVFN